MKLSKKITFVNFLEQIGPLYAEIYDITPFSMGVRWSGLRYHDEPLSDVRADSWSTGIKRQDSNAEEPYFQVVKFPNQNIIVEIINTV